MMCRPPVDVATLMVWEDGWEERIESSSYHKRKYLVIRTEKGNWSVERCKQRVLSLFGNGADVRESPGRRELSCQVRGLNDLDEEIGG